MKLLLVCIGAIWLSFLIGFAVGLVFPPPLDIILSLVLGWLFAYYVVSPIVVPMIFGEKE